MKITKLFVAACISIAIPVACLTKANADQVYKTIDGDGNVTFTDKPPAGSNPKKVEIRPVNTQDAVQPPEPEVAVSSEQEAGENNEVEEVPYTSSLITQPLNNAAVTAGMREVTVQIGLKPPLQAGHRVKLYHNGELKGSPTTSTRFTLTELIRGEHKVRAQVVGPEGKSKAETQTITFYVHRYSTQKPKPRPSPR